MAGIRFNTGSGIDPKMVDKLIELEQKPIKDLETKKKKVEDEKKLYSDLRGMVTALGTAATGFRTRTDFVKLKLTSSHDDIIDGSVDNSVPVGTYEVEVKQLARSQKMLTQSFPDQNDSPVGFGYMTIETEDDVFDVDIDPDHSTLQEVAATINGLGKGVKALVLNTKENLEDPGEDAFRLLVINEKSGKQANVYIDPDTTYLDFDEHVKGQNLEMLFEDVDVYNDTNKVNDLIKGMALTAKKSEPGTKVYLTVEYDVDKTMKGVKEFIDAYNKVNEFLDKQFRFDSSTGHAGPLSKENNLRALRRSLQRSLQFDVSSNTKYRVLSEAGISTDSKTGALKYDESKLKQALTDKYEEVVKLFAQSDDALGLGVRVSDAVRQTGDPQSGVFPSKDREYRKIVDNIDKNIANKQRLADQRAEGIKKKFTSLQQTLNNFRGQSQAMQAQLGGASQSLLG